MKWMKSANFVWRFPKPKRTCSGATISAQDRRKEFLRLWGWTIPPLFQVVKRCTPAELLPNWIEREDIRPAPYVGRYKWVMLDRLDAVRWDELQELIRVVV